MFNQQQAAWRAAGAPTDLYVASKEGVSDIALHFGVEQRADVVCLIRGRNHTRP